MKFFKLGTGIVHSLVAKGIYNKNHGKMEVSLISKPDSLSKLAKHLKKGKPYFKCLRSCVEIIHVINNFLYIFLFIVYKQHFSVHFHFGKLKTVAQ